MSSKLFDGSVDVQATIEHPNESVSGGEEEFDVVGDENDGPSFDERSGEAVFEEMSSGGAVKKKEKCQREVDSNRQQEATHTSTAARGSSKRTF